MICCKCFCYFSVFYLCVALKVYNMSKQYWVVELLNRKKFKWQIEKVPALYQYALWKRTLHPYILHASLHQHRTVNSNYCSISSPATAACSIPSSDPDCRQRVTRGRGRGFLETRTKSDTKSRGRVARGQGWPESEYEHKASSSSGNKQAAGQTRGRLWRPETLLNLDANFAL